MEKEVSSRAGLLSITDAARFLAVSTRTVWSLVGDGSLPSLRIGRRRLVRTADLERFVAKRLRA